MFRIALNDGWLDAAKLKPMPSFRDHLSVACCLPPRLPALSRQPGASFTRIQRAEDDVVWIVVSPPDGVK
jgi:hypothetical protein